MLVKRCIDILGAIVGLIVMFIAMIFVGPAIMIESPGPIFSNRNVLERMAVILRYISSVLCIWMLKNERKILWHRMR